MLDFYPIHIYYPLDEAEKKYQSGALKQTEAHLLDFVDRHLEEIIDIAANENNDSIQDNDILEAVKSEVLARGSIQPAAELAEIIKEINNEIWYKGEIANRAQSPREIAELWQAEYAVKWHEAKLFEIFVVLEHCKASVLDKFREIRK